MQERFRRLGSTPKPEGPDAPTSAFFQVPGATLGASGTAKSQAYLRTYFLTLCLGMHLCALAKGNPNLWPLEGNDRKKKQLRASDKEGVVSVFVFVASFVRAVEPGAWDETHIDFLHVQN